MSDIPLIFRYNTKRALNVKDSVAIVGNSDLLSSSSHGPDIDAHDSVFRFNLAPLEQQYAQAIGNKSDFFLLSQNITTYHFPHKEELQARFIQICRKSKIICYPEHEKNVLRFNKRPYYMSIDVPTVNRVLRKFLHNNLNYFDLQHHPRNGIKLVACLIDAGIKPDLYGFDLETRDNNSHYFDDEPQEEHTDFGHVPSQEFKVLTALKEKGLVNIL